MSQLTIHECDICKKRVDNYYWSPGWIRFTNDSIHNLCQTLGYNNQDKIHDSNTITAPNDFCSKRCMIDWVERNFKEQEMSQLSKPKEFWTNWMSMHDNLDDAKDNWPKAEWEDLRCYVAYEDYESQRAVIEKLEAEISRLKEIEWMYNDLCK